MRVWVALLVIAPWSALAKPIQSPVAPLDPPEIGCASAVVIDAADGTVLHEREADVLRFPASTTKILTALLLLERARPDDVVVAPAGVEKVGGASLHLIPGERLNVRDLVYAILLRSANDACVAAAVHVAGSVESFARLMNDRARAIGCRSSRFVNPHGLHDPLHQTTARDLALIAREAMRRPDFRAIVRTQRRVIERSLNDKDRLLINKNRVLRKDETTIGVKTGFTNPAGRCFVGAVEREGFEVVTVVLGSSDWPRDHLALADWAYRHHAVSKVARRGDFAGLTPVKGGKASEVRAELSEDVRWVARKGATARVEFEPSPVEAPVLVGQRIGVASVIGESGQRREVDVVAAAAVAEAPSAWPWALMLGAVALGVGAAARRRPSPGSGRVARRS
jgi:D-alanyl-D-alanine carboxypeptidase